MSGDRNDVDGAGAAPAERGSADNGASGRAGGGTGVPRSGGGVTRVAARGVTGGAAVVAGGAAGVTGGTVGVTVAGAGVTVGAAEVTSGSAGTTAGPGPGGSCGGSSRGAGVVVAAGLAGDEGGVTASVASVSRRFVSAGTRASSPGRRFSWSGTCGAERNGLRLVAWITNQMEATAIATIPPPYAIKRVGRMFGAYSCSTSSVKSAPQSSSRGSCCGRSGRLPCGVRERSKSNSSLSFVRCGRSGGAPLIVVP
jgi:hypothetical protein